MGCWNGTCAITQLPIIWGDEIVLIPLLSTGHEFVSGLTYNATDKFVPLCLPIYGKYNDYGGIEEINTLPANEEFFKKQEFFQIANDEEITEEKLINAIKKCSMNSLGMFVNKLNDEHKLEKIEYEKFENLEEFLNQFIYDEGYLIKYHTWQSDYPGTNYMMIHKKLYDTLINEIGNRIPYDQEKTLRELWKEKIKREINKKKEIMSIENEERRDIKLWSYKMESMSKRLGLVELSNESLGYEYFLNILYENMDEKLLDEFVNLILLTSVLSRLRKGYLCMSGLGHQGNEIYLHLLIADFIKDYAAEKIRKYDEEWIREDDFSEKEFLSESTYWWDDKRYDDDEDEDDEE